MRVQRTRTRHFPDVAIHHSGADDTGAHDETSAPGRPRTLARLLLFVRPPITSVRRFVATLLVCLTSGGVAHASDVAVRYLVERAPLRSLAATAAVTVELHGDAACSAPMISVPATLGDLDAIIDVKRITLRGDRPKRRVVELRYAASGVPAASAVYAHVVGDGVVPTGGACQVQAFVPPPVVPHPIVRDAHGTRIGPLALMTGLGVDSDAQTAVLQDDGHGVYGLAIGSMIFASFDHGFTYPSADCSGTPFLPRRSVLAPTTWREYGEELYGPAGPPSVVTLQSFLDVYGCQDTGPYTELAVPLMPLMPLGLERFVPPFHIDHAPQAP